MSKLNSLIKVALSNPTMINAFYKSRDIANEMANSIANKKTIMTPEKIKKFNHVRRRTIDIMHGLKKRGIKG